MLFSVSSRTVIFKSFTFFSYSKYKQMKCCIGSHYVSVSLTVTLDKGKKEINRGMMGVFSPNQSYLLL